MPNKTTTQILKEFREKFTHKDAPHIVLSFDAVKYEQFLTEALSQQQQEDYQEVLDLVDNAQSMGTLHSEEPPIDLIDRKELRRAIAEKRGKV